MDCGYTYMLSRFLADSWAFYKAHFWALFLIMAPILLPFELFSLVYQSVFITEESGLTEQGVIVFLGILVNPLIMIPVVFYVRAAVADNADAGSGDQNNYWDLRRRYWADYLVLNLLVFAAVIAGLFLFIVPGIILAMRYAFAEFELLLNNERPLNAMVKSWHSTKKYFWDILLGTLIIVLIFYLPFSLLFSFIDSEDSWYWLLSFVTNIAFSLLGAFYVVFYFRIFDFHRSSGQQQSRAEIEG